MKRSRAANRRRTTLLCVGGLDPSGGAGILADIRAAHAAGGSAVAVAAALTAQSSDRVDAVRAVPRGWVRAQIRSLAQEERFGAVKTGLIAAAWSVRELAAWYRRARPGPLVVDPVFEAGTGASLMSGAARRALLRELAPHATLITPNRREAERLSGVRIVDIAGMERAARAIGELGPRAVLLKGGHVAGSPIDLLWDGRTVRRLASRRRLPGRWHGLGCHLASAIAARLALGDPLLRAVVRARAVLDRGMRGAVTTRHGTRVPSWR